MSSIVDWTSPELVRANLAAVTAVGTTVSVAGEIFPVLRSKLLPELKAPTTAELLKKFGDSFYHKHNWPTDFWWGDGCVNHDHDLAAPRTRGARARSELKFRRLN